MNTINKPNVEALHKLGLVSPSEIKIGAGEMGAILEAVIKDKDGNIVKCLRKKSESFVKQFLMILQSQMEHLWTGYANYPNHMYSSVKDINGNNHYLSANASTFACEAALGSTSWGLLVGTVDTAPTIDDYYLGTLIAHGTGAGQLQYSAVSFGAPTCDGNTAEFSITRSFANGSAGTVTVKEVGLVVLAYDFVGTGYYFLTIRDIMNLAVLTTQTLSLNYLIRAAI